MNIIKEFKDEYRWLSNFHRTDVNFEGLVYPTAEHAFQAAKTLNIDEREFIKRLSTPGQAKRAGRGVNLRSNWNDIRLDIMLEVVRCKFNGNKELSKKLIESDPLVLVEGNYWNDTFWGVCNGKGSNWLGNTLMHVRSELILKERGIL